MVHMLPFLVSAVAASSAHLGDGLDGSTLLQVSKIANDNRIVTVFKDFVADKESICLAAVEGEKAPLAGVFTGVDGHKFDAHVGDVARTNGMFCVQSAKLALLQRSLGMNSVHEFEKAVEQKGSGSGSNIIDGVVTGKFRTTTPPPAFQCPVTPTSLLHIAGNRTDLPDWLSPSIGPVGAAIAAVNAAVNVANQAGDIVAKLVALKSAVTQARTATVAASQAVITEADNIEQIGVAIVGPPNLAPLFDGVYNSQDIAALIHFSAYMEVVERILKVTGDLQTISCALNDIVAVLRSITDLLQAFPGIISDNVGQLDTLTTTLEDVVEQFNTKTTEIDSIGSELRPILAKWKACAVEGMQIDSICKTLVVTNNFATLSRVVVKLGPAWIAAQDLFETSVQPAMTNLGGVTSSLVSSVLPFNLPL